MHKLSRRDWCAQLCYRSGKEWTRLPDWAVSLVDIGFQIEHLQESDERVVTVLILPHRGFAASFLALGSTLARPVASFDAAHIEDHFAQLIEFTRSTPGAPLLLIRNGVCTSGSSDGVEMIDGKPFIKVLLTASQPGRTGRNTQFIGKAGSKDLHIDPSSSFVVGKNEHKRNVANNQKFLAGLYTNDEMNSLYIAAQSSTTLVTQAGSLQQEVVAQEFACIDDCGARHIGCLNDVLRVDRFISEHLRPRTILRPSGANESGSSVAESHITVLDGSQAYLRWSYHFNRSHIVTLLCHSDPHVDLAVDEINRRYLSKSENTHGAELRSLSVPANGAEGMVFWEKKH